MSVERITRDGREKPFETSESFAFGFPNDNATNDLAFRFINSCLCQVFDLYIKGVLDGERVPVIDCKDYVFGAFGYTCGLVDGVIFKEKTKPKGFWERLGPKKPVTSTFLSINPVNALLNEAKSKSNRSLDFPEPLTYDILNIVIKKETGHSYFPEFLNISNDELTQWKTSGARFADLVSEALGFAYSHPLETAKIMEIIGLDLKRKSDAANIESQLSKLDDAGIAQIRKNLYSVYPEFKMNSKKNFVKEGRRFNANLK